MEANSGIPIGEVIQLVGVLVSLLVVLERILSLIRDWRGGSPELRTIRDQLAATNGHMNDLLRRILTRLEAM